MCGNDKKRISKGTEVGNYKTLFRDPRSMEGRVGGKARQGGWGHEYLLWGLLCGGEMKESLAGFQARE